MSNGRTPAPFWTPFLLGAVLALLVFSAGQGLLAPRSAYAQVPDSGRQRKEMIDELKQVNVKLEQIHKKLTEMHADQRKANPQGAGE